jgi:hypothetical protein
MCVNKLRKLLGGARTSHDIFNAQTAAFGRTRLLVRCYYVMMFFYALTLLPDWTALSERNSPAALWPVAWLHSVNLRTGIAAIMALYLSGALAAAILPGQRWARAAAFLGIFEFVAFNNSYGKIGHAMHTWVITAGLLIFLPALDADGQPASRAKRQQFLTIFWACQALVLLLYSMSGLGKVAGAVYQLSAGQTSAFAPGALAAIIANRLTETNSKSLLGPWLIEHPLAGWPMLWGDIYLQLFSFIIAFRPSLHRIWALALIVFHIASYLLLTINFAPSALLLALLFFNSPFRREYASWHDCLTGLPLFGRLFPRSLPRPCVS